MSRKIIIGNGWAALGTLAFELAASSDIELIWVLGSGTRVPPVLPTLPKGEAVASIRKLMELCGAPLEPVEEGEHVSEFRNKSFRPVSWDKLSEELWGAERHLLGEGEMDCGISLDEADQILRAKINDQVGSRIRKIEECAIREIKTSASAVSVVLVSGETLEADECIFADRWSDLRAIKGSPRRATIVDSEKEIKLAELLRKSDATGVLQVTFHHNIAMNVQERQGFFAVTHRESGEQFDRRVWGYFLNDKTSRWSLVLGHEEAEDNHLIAKKIRRIKQTLNRTAADARWCPEGVKEFSDTIESEHVRLEENVLFSEGDVVSGALQSGSSLKIIGDSFGVGVALGQLADLYVPKEAS